MKCLATGFVSGMHYAKRYPEFLDFDVMKYYNPELDWERYNRRSALVMIGRCERAAESYFDLSKEEREANIDDLKRIMWFVEVILDEEKNHLDRKKAFDDLNIKELFDKYL